MDKTLQQRLRLRAHTLNPVILIGQHGLTEAVHAEVARTLYDHELIKIKINQHPREAIKEMAAELVKHHQAFLIQQVGHTIVLYLESDKHKEKLKKQAGPKVREGTGKFTVPKKPVVKKTQVRKRNVLTKK